MLYLGDCLEVMRTLPAASVDLILCDLPYGTTACSWDAVIPFEPLWAAYKRIAKPKRVQGLDTRAPKSFGADSKFRMTVVRFRIFYDSRQTLAWDAGRLPWGVYPIYKLEQLPDVYFGFARGVVL